MKPIDEFLIKDYQIRINGLKRDLFMVNLAIQHPMYKAEPEKYKDDIIKLERYEAEDSKELEKLEKMLAVKLEKLRWK